jgi:HEAT repeat protein
MRTMFRSLLIAMLAASVGLPLAAQGKAATPAFPALDDAKAISKYFAAADQDGRLKLYEAYFQKASLSYGGTPSLDASFTKDFEAASPELRARMSGFLFAALKRPEEIRSFDPSGNPLFGRMSYSEPVKLLGLMALYEDSLKSYYTALPFKVRIDSTDGAVALSGKRASILLKAAPAILPAMSPDGRRVLLAEVLRWPSRLGKADYDTASLRALQKLLGAADYSFFGAVGNAAAAFSRVESKAFAAAAPSQDEILALAPGIFAFGGFYSSANSAAKLELRYPKASGPVGLMSAMAASSDPRLVAMKALADALRGTKPKACPSMAEIAALKDDWAAACWYRAASLGGASPKDEEVLACLDPARPSLAASILEDRFQAEYSEFYDQAIALSASGSAEPDAAFKKAVIERCLALRSSKDPQVLIPVLKAIIALGGTKYVNNVYVLLPYPDLVVRRTAYEGLVRYADPSMLSSFLAGLSDSDSEIRTLCIRGLGAIKDSRGIDPLARILADATESEYIRAEAARALGEIGDRRAIQIFSSALLVPRGKGGRDFRLRVIAAQYLGEARERSAVEALLSNIDPADANELNYRCLEALGKIASPEGWRRLLPIAQGAWERWLAEPGQRDRDNLYALCWALFLYQSPEAEALYASIFDKAQANKADAAFLCAYWLVRNAASPSEEARGYLADKRAGFFANERKAYEFARLLEKRWDPESLLCLASRLEGYGTATQSWVLGCMAVQPDPRFLDCMKSTRGSDSGTVRDWTSSVVLAIAKSLPKPATSEGQQTASAVLAFLDSWDEAEKNSSVLSRTAQARRLAEACLKVDQSM